MHRSNVEMYDNKIDAGVLSFLSINYFLIIYKNENHILYMIFCIVIILQILQVLSYNL